MIRTWVSEILNLVFPETCTVCNNSLLYSEKILCTSCLLDIPRVYFHNQERNPLEDLLWGRVHYEKASSLFHYSKDSKYSSLLYSVKYHNRDDVGVFLGELLAVELQSSGFFDGIDCIVPVPLHKKRMRKRGYNQSQKIAEGMAKICGLPVETNYISRTKNNETQTRKNKEEREENVQNIFATNSSISGKHVLLVDDVITTGSTIISCAEEILKDNKVSIVSIGFA